MDYGPSRDNTVGFPRLSTLLWRPRPLQAFLAAGGHWLQPAQPPMVPWCKWAWRLRRDRPSAAPLAGPPVRERRAHASPLPASHPPNEPRPGACSAFQTQPSPSTPAATCQPSGLRFRHRQTAYTIGSSSTAGRTCLYLQGASSRRYSAVQSRKSRLMLLWGPLCPPLLPLRQLALCPPGQFLSRGVSTTASVVIFRPMYISP